MTVVSGDLVNVLGVKQDGIVRIASSYTRPDGSQVIVDDWDEVDVKGGKFTATVAGGPARFQVIAGSTSRVFEVMVPGSGTVTFASLLENVVEWWPEVVTRAALEARAAADSAKAAAGSASTAASSANTAKADAAKAAGSASSAKSSETVAKTSADAAKLSEATAVKSAAAAGESASAAKTSETNAAASADAAKTSETNAGKSASAAKTSEKSASAASDAAKSAAERVGSAEQVKTWATNARTAADESVAAREATWSYRSVALDARDKAVESESASAASATTASDAASRVSASESAAKASAASAASSASAAKTSETNAGKSASAAKSEADRAANIASSTSWDGDKLTVNGKTSPSLTGPRGEKGAPGDAARATTTEYGSIKLSGDLGGTSDEPRVVSPLSGSIIPFEGDRQAWAVASGLEKTVDGNVPPGAYYTMTKNTVFSERAFRVTPGVPYYFAVWIKSDKPGQKTYLEVRKHGDLGTQSLSVESGTIGASDASYFIGDAEVPTEWTLWETVIRFKPSASKLIVGRWYPNHPRGKERNAQLMVGDIMLTPLSPDLEARQSVKEIQGLAANAVGNEMNKITRIASANQLVKTGTDGSIWIQTVAVTDQHHATNKAYVDGALNGKADVSHKHAVADITGLPAISDTPTGGTLVQRSSSGTIRCNAPEGPNNAANKGYVDTALQSVAKGAFELRVASSAPASGTASNVITFVKE